MINAAKIRPIVMRLAIFWKPWSKRFASVTFTLTSSSAFERASRILFSRLGKAPMNSFSSRNEPNAFPAVKCLRILRFMIVVTFRRIAAVGLKSGSRVFPTSSNCSIVFPSIVSSVGTSNPFFPACRPNSKRVLPTSIRFRGVSPCSDTRMAI